MFICTSFVSKTWMAVDLLASYIICWLHCPRWGKQQLQTKKLTAKHKERLTITAIVTAKIFDLYFLVNEKDPKLQKSSSYTSSTTGCKNCFTICMSKWSEIWLCFALILNCSGSFSVSFKNRYGLVKQQSFSSCLGHFHDERQWHFPFWC